MTRNTPEIMTPDSAGNALGTINNIIVKNDTAVEAIFFGDDKQLHIDEDGTENIIDTIWVYYDDMIFEQFAEFKDEIVLYIIGTYRLEDGGDFIYASSDEDHGDIVINRTQKYKAGEGLVPYESSHTYDLSTLGFYQLVVIE